MKILFDIGHPAHVHFFKHPIRILRQRNHQVLVTSRRKEFATQLLDELGIEHTTLSSKGKGGLFSLGAELIQRNIALLKFVKKNQVDIMAAIGGVNIAHVGKLTSIPSLVFYDTENATLQNLITYPFASRVIVPRCYKAWLPRKTHLRYDGYHELSYLHPDVFSPDRNVALANGLAEQGDTFFIRVVSWQASHDIGEKGWSEALLKNTVERLEKQGKVLISSESPLSPSLNSYCYTGKLSEVHHLLAYCKLFVGESATMASEAAVLGTPAIYAANTGRGYTDEQQDRYHLVRNIQTLNWETLSSELDNMLQQQPGFWQQARDKLLADTINVAEFVATCIENYPDLSAPGQVALKN